MSKLDKGSKSGFIIKLTNETAQKLADEDRQAKETDVTEGSSTGLETSNSVASTSNIDKEITLKVDKSIETSSSDATIKQTKSESVTRYVTNTSDNVQIGESIKNTSESDAYSAYAQYVTYEGSEAIYTDPSTQTKYTWDSTNNSWVPKTNQEVPGRVYSYEDDTHVYTDPDGSKSFWDDDKKAWLPKVDEDFLAHYQMAYGFVDNVTRDDKDKSEKEDSNTKESKGEQSGVKRKNEPQWFDASDENNTKVYVSNLPQDLTETEFVDLMQKCGLVMKDLTTNKMKVRLYMDKEHNCFKGDALCTYIKIESVDLALKLLDGYEYKGNKIRVERAHFQLKGEYNPALKPKKRKKKEIEKLKRLQEKLFDWRPEKIIGERAKHEKVVIIKNLFDPSDFDKEVQLILDYQQDLREECSKCGEVRKVVIYDRHPEGVAQVTMKEPEQADAVVALINGRWFGKRQISVEIWDGRTKYRIAETQADIDQRIQKWDKFLEGEEKASDTKGKKESDQLKSEDSVSSSVETGESAKCPEAMIKENSA